MPGRSITSLSSRMTQVGGSLKTTGSASSISDIAVAPAPHVKEQLQKLSFQIIRHANILQSVMGIEVLSTASAAPEKPGAAWRGSDQNAFKVRIENSLKEVTKALNDVLAASQI
ncbi:hypothetical protein M413DRAFT_127198 [Hebeloma cylindrosporum]|uniref:Uncharacterized protein n=1 Tax=Hebeloma cylindrosporum TaxID=76867 RepID=A0A0C2YMA5_HEBCY|nr:hypothetical protein M413DRAFT_127198 [Hebeloma cylindrosporum h7]